MFFFDSLLVGSLRFVLDKLVVAAEQELHDDAALRERLLEARMKLELGELTEDEFADIERDVFARLREARGGETGALSIDADDVTIVGVDVSVVEDPDP